MKLHIWQAGDQNQTNLQTLIQLLRPQLGSPQFALIQTLAQMRAEEVDALVSSEGSSAGRLFGPLGELRWLREADGCYRIWIIAEAAFVAVKPAAEWTSRSVRVQNTRYYLLGRFSKSNGSWEERHLNRDLREYFTWAHHPQDNDRGYAEVREYFPAAETPNADNKGYINLELNHLNSPRVVAHRFVALAAGQEIHPGVNND